VENSTLIANRSIKKDPLPHDLNLIAEEEIIQDLLPRKFKNSGRIWVGILIAICLAGAFAYYRQLRYGLVVTNMRDYSFLGYLYFKLCVFCSHKFGWLINNSRFQACWCKMGSPPYQNR